MMEDAAEGFDYSKADTIWELSEDGKELPTTRKSMEVETTPAWLEEADLAGWKQAKGVFWSLDGSLLSWY